MSEEKDMLAALAEAPKARAANPFTFEQETPLGRIQVVATGLTTARFVAREPLRFEGHRVLANGTVGEGADGTWTVTEIQTSMTTGKDFARLVGRDKMATFAGALARNVAKAFEGRRSLLLKREVVALHKQRKDLDEAIDRTCGMIDRWQEKLATLMADKERMAAEHAETEATLLARIREVEGAPKP